jgi:hypothetical protein
MKNSVWACRNWQTKYCDAQKHNDIAHMVNHMVNVGSGRVLTVSENKVGNIIKIINRFFTSIFVSASVSNFSNKIADTSNQFSP